MQPSIARASEQLDPRLQLADIPPPQSATLVVKDSVYSAVILSTGRAGINWRLAPSIFQLRFSLTTSSKSTILQLTIA